MIVAIFGAGGQLGRDLCRTASRTAIRSAPGKVALPGVVGELLGQSR
jgi:dTDP-4-dehydrorhamnose reductase